MRPLVLVAHGTKDPAGALVTEALAAATARRLGQPVTVAYADVREPRLSEVLVDDAVVVPAFLASGYHVRVDVPAEVVASGCRNVTVTPAFGAAPQLVALAALRLVEAGWRSGDAVVLGAAGSSDEGALTEVRAAAALLSDRLGEPVEIGYVTTAAPGLGTALEAARRTGRRVSVASWLLAPGLFHQALRVAGHAVVAEPLGAHDRVVDLVVQRYLAATV
ncbi:CbiX/SirB N-terminal domain-containing protein [Crossiella sp. CA-258035]|uniref:sirohydrochlorin chelatase n=1 Tax=Crossiella sp. CA-258035 TaxID=2981138 RepID=UPI0024BD4F9E|nr:CbiX/SirB N-terminal domain-containing protein [Crossiella sp. CA-258035]WHT18504.1 CbiX/SirB N-terminal domain-containing protein [Crossiella sp. CA-258035]